MDLKAVLNLVQKPANTRDDIAAALEALDLAGAEQRADDLEAKRQKILISGSDHDLAAIEQKIAAANREIERTIAMRDEFERRLSEIDDADKIADRQQAYDKALKQSADARKALLRYPSIAKQMIEVLAIVADAEAAIAAANSDLPDGAKPLTPAEMTVRSRNGGDIPPLASSIRLPDFDPTKPHLWEPVGPSGYGSNYSDGIEVVLDRIADIRMAKSA